MLTVTLTKDMRPWRAGDEVPLPDALAEQLVAAGEATGARPFSPEAAPAAATSAPAPAAAPSKRRYMTRSR
jgi:hypothetical protein